LYSHVARGLCSGVADGLRRHFEPKSIAACVEPDDVCHLGNATAAVGACDMHDDVDRERDGLSNVVMWEADISRSGHSVPAA